MGQLKFIYSLTFFYVIFRALNAFSGCVMNPIRQNCGVQAWQVIFRVLRDTTNTLMPACEFIEHSTINSNSEKILYIQTNGPLTTTKSNINENEKISAEWSYPKSDERQKFSKNLTRNSHRIRGPLENRRNDFNNQGQKYAQQLGDVRIGFEEDPNLGNRLHSFVYGLIICFLVIFF